MSIGEIIFCLVMFLPLVATAVFKQWRLFLVFMTFDILFGLQEWMSVAQTGSSISQGFWIFDTAHPVKGTIIIISMAVMWAALLIHLKVHKSKEK